MTNNGQQKVVRDYYPGNTLLPVSTLVNLHEDIPNVPLKALANNNNYLSANIVGILKQNEVATVIESRTDVSDAVIMKISVNDSIGWTYGAYLWPIEKID